MFCKHSWNLISEVTTKSKFECVTETMRNNVTNVRIPHQLCCADRKFIQVVQCTKCGKLKRFVENI